MTNSRVNSIIEKQEGKEQLLLIVSLVLIPVRIFLPEMRFLSVIVFLLLAATSFFIGQAYLRKEGSPFLLKVFAFFHYFGSLVIFSGLFLRSLLIVPFSRQIIIVGFGMLVLSILLYLIPSVHSHMKKRQNHGILRLAVAVLWSLFLLIR
ncbi:MAG TPA: hypothetical protein DCS15_00240 [Flavobacteriales bacterium]|jgi:hypothetical protein|nr:hypothetical protein [Flavobacteriales bacterium]